ncbi:MAG: hypothetical protein ACI9CA_000811, partial [Natronomonas sp.]
MQRRSVTDDDGTLIHMLEYSQEESTFDTVAIRYPIETDRRLHVLGYLGEEIVYQQSFEIRDLSFAPVTVMGKGEMDTAVGLTADDDVQVDDEDVDDAHADDVETATPESPTGYTNFDGVP